MNTRTLSADHCRHDSVTEVSALPAHVTAAHWQREAAGIRELSKVLATAPAMATTCILEIARALCRAPTAGVSVLKLDGAGQTIVRWDAISGALAHYAGKEVARQSSPCGLCLDAESAIVLSRPDRMFGEAMKTRPAVAEYLIVPLPDTNGAALGTLWLAHHDSASHFAADDARVMEQLAHQLVLAMKLQEHARNRDRAVRLLQAHQVAQRNLAAQALHRERKRRKRAEAAEQDVRRALEYSEAMITESEHRTKNTLQAAAGLLSLQARAVSSVEAREALLDSRARLHSLAQVHALLCHAQDQSQSIRMPALLNSICHGLRESHGHKHPSVALEVVCDPISLPASNATCFALFCNEAVTNAYKHAFPDATSGEIRVCLQRTRENALKLSVIDSGVGASTAPSKSVGLMLMQTWATNLRGAFETSPCQEGRGTQVTLTVASTAVFGSRM